MCINSVKETCFSQNNQKWICLILELNSSIIVVSWEPELKGAINKKLYMYYKPLP